MPLLPVSIDITMISYSYHKDCMPISRYFIRFLIYCDNISTHPKYDKTTGKDDKTVGKNDKTDIPLIYGNTSVSGQVMMINGEF